MRIFISILFLTMISCSIKPKNCTNFKTGTFKYEKSNYNHIIITRNDSLQTEYNNKDNIKITTSVEWTSDCEYVLTYKNVSNYQYDNEIKNKKIFVTILNTDKNSYTARAKSNTTNTVFKMIKLKE